jgi:hypothetical protein
MNPSTCHSFWGTFSLQRKRWSSPNSLLTKPRPLWFFPISENEMKLKGATFWEHTDEIQANPHDVMKMLTQNNFYQCFWSRKSCWDHCIKTEGDYFEGDGGKFQELLGRTSYIFKGLSNLFQLFDFSFLPSTIMFQVYCLAFRINNFYCDIHC